MTGRILLWKIVLKGGGRKKERTFDDEHCFPERRLPTHKKRGTPACARARRLTIVRKGRPLYLFIDPTCRGNKK